MRRNKINRGWDAIPKQKKKEKNSNISWTLKYEYSHLREDNFISKIIKFIIRVSLFFAFNDRKMTKIKKTTIINQTYNILSSSKFKFIPSSVAFYLFLSVIPITIIVMSVLSVFSGNWNDFLINQILPRIVPGMQDLFKIKIDLTSNNILFVLIFIASSIWFASKGIAKFGDSFVELYGYDDKRNFIIKRIKAILIVVFVALYFSIVAFAYTPIMYIISHNVTSPALYDFIFYLLSFFYLLIFGYLGIWLLFRFISPIRLKLGHLNLGILVSLIPTILFFLLFSSICKFLNYEKFGPIGSFLYLMLFILYISYFLHAGIIINSSYYKANVLTNVEVRKSLLTKKMVVLAKNIWYKIKFKRK